MSDFEGEDLDLAAVERENRIVAEEAENLNCAAAEGESLNRAATEGEDLNLAEVERDLNRAAAVVLNEPGPSSGANVAVGARRISIAEYELEKLWGAAGELRKLLDQIVEDKGITEKVRRSRLNHFKLCYPHIYAEKFGNEEILRAAMERDSKKKRCAIL